MIQKSVFLVVAAALLLVSLPAAAQDVVVSGGLGYVANFWHGLGVIDLADPSAPGFLGEFDLFQAQRVAVAGDHVFVMDVANGLRIFTTQCGACSAVFSTMAMGRYAGMVATS